jgi:hypothetical protein
MTQEMRRVFLAAATAALLAGCSQPTADVVRPGGFPLARCPDGYMYGRHTHLCYSERFLRSRGYKQ